MLVGLTIIIATIIALGVVMIMTSEGDSLPLVNGMIFATFGATALFWIAKGTVQYLRGDGSGLLWLYRPLATLPEWVGYIGMATTAGLLVISIALLVDDYIHLPRRRKGGRH